MNTDKFSGSYQEIVGHYDSAEELFNSVANDSGRLVQLFKKAVEAKNSGAACDIGDRIKELDVSLLSVESLVQTITIAEELLQQASVDTSEGKVLALIETFDRLLTTKLSLRDSLDLFISTKKTLEASELSPKQEAVQRHLQDLSRKSLKDNGIAVSGDDSSSLRYDFIKDYSSINESFLSEKFYIAEMPPQLRLAFFRSYVLSGIENPLQNLHIFKVDEASFSDRFEMCRFIHENRPDLSGSLASMAHLWLYDWPKERWAEGCKAVFMLDSNPEGYQLCKAMAQHGPQAQKFLMRFFEKFDSPQVTAQERIRLCELLVECDGLAEELVKNIDQFNLEGTSVQQRMGLCMKAVEVSAQAAAALPKRLKKFNLDEASIDDRLDLYTKIINIGSRGLTEFVASIGSLNLDDVAPGAWVNLVNACLEKHPDLTPFIAGNLDKFRVDSFDKAVQIDLYARILANGSDAAMGLANNIKNIKLDALSVDERFNLCLSMMSFGGKVAASLIENIDVFNLKDAKQESLVDLCEHLIKTEDRTILINLSKSIDKFNIKDINQRLKFCKDIIEAKKPGGHVLLAACQNIEKFKLDDADFDARQEIINFLSLSATSGGLEAVVGNIDKFPLTPDERLQLCKSIVQNGYTTSLSTYHLGKLQLENTGLQGRLELCKLMAIHSPDQIVELYKNIITEDLSPEEQITFLDMPVENLIKAYVFLKEVFKNNAHQLIIEDRVLAVLNSIDLPPEKILQVAKLAVKRSSLPWYAEVEHPVFQAAIGVISASEASEARNPFHLYKQLQELSTTPSSFKTPQVTIGNASLSISLEQLSKLRSEVERTDLPPHITLISFEKFYNAFKAKVLDPSGDVTKEADKAFKEIFGHGQIVGQDSESDQPIDEAEIFDEVSWAKLDGPIYDDPQRFLLKLLEKSEGTVSESEAFFKAVLASIFDKSTTVKGGSFFTEQEDVFITTMIHIRNCHGGKVNGINLAYACLEPKFQYNIVKSNVEVYTVETENRERALQELTAFLESYAMEDKTPVDILLEYAAKGDAEQTQVNTWATALTADYPDLDLFFDEEEFNVTPFGLQTAVAELQTAVMLLLQAGVESFVAQVVTGIRNKLFDSGTPLMEEWTGDKNPNEGTHHAIYLKNLIGPVIGAAHQVTFDRHTGVLVNTLIEKSREEVLEILFKHLTPEAVANELIRAAENSTDSQKKMLQSYMPEKSFWKDDMSTLSLQGALSLLQQLKYVNVGLFQ